MNCTGHNLIDMSIRLYNNKSLFENYFDIVFPSKNLSESSNSELKNL
jgi:hypothetical protein